MSAVDIILPEQRLAAIQARLAETGRVLAADLARDFSTSEDTIRRDLRTLAEAGLCRRVYGGALPPSPASMPLAVRRLEQPGAKARLGRAAAALVQAGQLVALDAGSTNLAIAAALPDDLRCTIVTNAPAIAAALDRKPLVDVILLGGRVDRNGGGALGLVAIRAAEQLRPDLYLVGACALDPQAGLCVFGSEEADLKRSLAGVSAALATAVGDEKLGTGAPFHVAPWGALAHLVVERGASLADRLGARPEQGPRIHAADGGMAA